MGFVAPKPFRARSCFCGRPALAGEECCGIHLRAPSTRQAIPIRVWLAEQRRKQSHARCPWCGNARPERPRRCPDCGGAQDA